MGLRLIAIFGGCLRSSFDAASGRFFSKSPASAMKKSAVNSGFLPPKEEKPTLMVGSLGWSPVRSSDRTREQIAWAIQSVVGGTVRHVSIPSSYDSWEVEDLPPVDRLDGFRPGGHSMYQRVMKGQPELIKTMLRNVFENAAKHTLNNGNIHIAINNHQIKIKNSGMDIGEDFLPRLGERFFHPPGQAEPGSGLGLSIVQRITEIHNLQVSFGNIKTEECGMKEGFEGTIKLP